MTTRQTRWAWGAALVVLALVPLLLRLGWQSRAALREGEAAEAAGRTWEATTRYLDAARLYTPGLGPCHQAVDRLQALAERALAEGRPDDARRALEAIRAAALGTRSFYVPYERQLLEAERRLAPLYAVAELGGREVGSEGETRTAAHARILARRPGPRPGPAAVALSGLALWLGAAVAFFRIGLDASLVPRKVPAVASGVAFAVGLAMFLIGLRLA